MRAFIYAFAESVFECPHAVCKLLCLNMHAHAFFSLCYQFCILFVCMCKRVCVDIVLSVLCACVRTCLYTGGLQEAVQVHQARYARSKQHVISHNRTHMHANSHTCAASVRSTTGERQEHNFPANTNTYKHMYLMHKMYIHLVSKAMSKGARTIAFPRSLAWRFRRSKLKDNFSKNPLWSPIPFFKPEKKINTCIHKCINRIYICVYIYMYIYVYTYIYILYIYTYIYII